MSVPVGRPLICARWPVAHVTCAVIAPCRHCRSLPISLPPPHPCPLPNVLLTPWCVNVGDGHAGHDSGSDGGTQRGRQPFISVLLR